MEEIEYLYHYTSIESLALILKNRTIRLNPLDKMDDLQEMKTKDVKNFGKFVYVSSWTQDEQESIPMWRMYTSPSAGVRIKLRKRPFVSFLFPVRRFRQTLSSDCILNDVEDKVYIDYNPVFDSNWSTPHFYGEDILQKVEYTNDNSILVPQMARINDGRIQLCLTGLGKHKNTYWEFQHEWRYLLSFFPSLFSDDADEKKKYNDSHISLFVKDALNPPYPYCDLKIEQSAFEEMEITTSPQMSLGNLVLLQALVEKYNPTATIKESALLGLL